MSGNTLTSNSSYGIYCVGSSPTISGNTVTGGSYGLFVMGAVIPLSVTGNTFSGFTTAGVYLTADASGTAVDFDNVFTGPVFLGGGNISANTTWNPGWVYYVTGGITVGSGATLSVDASRITKFAQNASVTVNGIMNVTGTAGNEVYFTDYRDDTAGGDTNGDGAATLPTPGWWSGIAVGAGGIAQIDRTFIRYATVALTKSGSGNLILTNSTITKSSQNGVSLNSAVDAHLVVNNTIQTNTGHGVSISSSGSTANIGGNTITGNTSSGIYISSSSPVIESNTITGNAQYGISLTGAGSASISRNRIENNSKGIYCTSSANPVIGGSFASANDITGNASHGVENTTSTIVVNATYNWWGHSTGPFHPVTNPSGQGNKVSDYVDYGNYLGTSAFASVPNLRVTPLVKDFGSAPVGGSIPGTFTATNNGTAPLEISWTAISSGSADFALTSDACSGQTLAPFATCVMDVLFSPASKGYKPASLVVASNDPEQALTPALVFGSGIPINLPRTGQSTPVSTGDDADIHAGFEWSSSRFLNNGNSTISDGLTGLIWSQEGNTAGPSACTPGVAKTWSVALTFVQCLNTNLYLGFDDWRLPNISELESLVNAGEASQVAWWSALGFTSLHASTIWSSTSSATAAGYAWAMDAGAGALNGAVRPQATGAASWVWPVRGMSTSPAQLWRTGQVTPVAAGDDGTIRAGAAWPETRFVAAADTSISDTLTGLVWGPDGGTPPITGCTGGNKTWAAALDYVACLNSQSYLGHGDWRLPNRKEIRSLADYSKNAPALPAGHPFTSVSAAAYWTSTTHAADTTRAWQHGFSGTAPGIQAALKTATAPVWPVRGGILPSSGFVSGTATICAGGSAAIQVALSGEPPFTVTWSDGISQTGMTSSPVTRNVTPGVTTTYSITSMWDANGSGEATGTAIITVIAGPAASNTGPYCTGATINLSATTLTGVTYAWTGPNGFTSTLQNPIIPNATTAEAGIYSVTATGNGCTGATGTTTVAVNPPLSAPITAPADICPGSTENVASVPDAGTGATYNWTVTNGSITSGAGTRAIQFSAGASGSVDLGVTVSDSLGCTGSGSSTIPIVSGAPTVTEFSPARGAAGTSVTVTGTNFVCITSVTFNGVSASFTVASATSLTATVPAGAATGRITVTNGSGTGTSPEDFVVGLSGDVNGDGGLDVADVFYLINHLFAGGSAPVGAADVNGDNNVDVADVFYLINHLFAGGPAPQ